MSNLSRIPTVQICPQPFRIPHSHCPRIPISSVICPLQFSQHPRIHQFLHQHICLFIPGAGYEFSLPLIFFLGVKLGNNRRRTFKAQ